MAIKEFFSNIASTLVEHSPEIAIGVGVAAVVGGTVAACVATVKSKDVIEEANKQLDGIAEDETESIIEAKDDEEVSAIVNAAKAERRKVYAKTGCKVALNYIGGVVLLAGGILSFCYSSNKWKQRAEDWKDKYAVAASSLAVVKAAYNKLRKNIREKYGEEEERNLVYGIKEEKVAVTYVDENGELKETKASKKKVSRGELAHPYAFRFSDCENFVVGNDVLNESKLNHETQDGKKTNYYESVIKSICTAQGWINLTEIYSQFHLLKRETDLAYLAPGYTNPDDIKLIIIPCTTEKMIGGKYRIINDWIIDFENIKDDITLKGV